MAPQALAAATSRGALCCCIATASIRAGYPRSHATLAMSPTVKGAEEGLDAPEDLSAGEAQAGPASSNKRRTRAARLGR